MLRGRKDQLGTDVIGEHVGEVEHGRDAVDCYLAGGKGWQDGPGMLGRRYDNASQANEEIPLLGLGRSCHSDNRNEAENDWCTHIFVPPC